MRKHLKTIVFLVVFLHLTMIFKFSRYTKKRNQKIQVETVYLRPKTAPIKPIDSSIEKSVQKPTSQLKKPVNQKKAHLKQKIQPPRPKSKQSSNTTTRTQKKTSSLSKEPYNKNWQQDLVEILYQKVDFPEFGRVKAKIEILGNGRVKSVEIINSENEKNEQYLLTTLMNLILPRWSIHANDKQMITITFANEMD